MARIPEHEIERLKSQIALEGLVEQSGVQLKKHGDNLLGLCPFHDDREPSLVVTPTKNLWHCLGACQTGGTVIDWVMKSRGVSFRHAVELLREGLPSLEAEHRPATTPGGPVKRSTVQRLSAGLEHSADDQALLRQVVDYYHETLKQSPDALEYLRKRGLGNSELVEHFCLGFANRTLGYRLPQKTRKTGAEIRGELTRLGIFRESGHEHLSGSLVIPVFDEHGQVSELYGRKVGERLRPGTPLHLYLPGPHRGVWNLAALQSSKEIILCESLIDACTFWCAGYRNVTAAYGVEGFTDDHRQAFERYGTERVLIAYDRDEAGDRAAEKLAAELGARGIECARVVFPRGMDANEYALKVGPAEKSLSLVLRQAEWMAGKRRSAAQTNMQPTSPEADSPEPTGPTGQPAPLSPLAAEPPPATPTVKSTAGSVERTPTPALTVNGEELVLAFGDRRWRVRGLPTKALPGSLRVNVLVSRPGGGMHVDTLELYSARQREHFVRIAKEELGLEERIVKRELGEVLLRLEELIDQRQREHEAAAKKQELTAEERAVALALLGDPNLLDRILEDFERCGVVGERTNKLVGYLAATSRKLEQPLAVVIQSSSAAGKSSLMDAVLALMPEEERVQYSAMTGQSLFYMGETNLSHKILAIVEEEGAERASYALKLLQSEGELTIASTGKDPTTGRLITQEYRVEGPVMIFLTTTAVDVDEELLNRCIVLTVDEGREQTKAIHERQRYLQTIEGLLEQQERQQIMLLHQNAQRLLRPMLVANPYARELGFLSHQTRTRRDHMKYLNLIRTVTLLYQYQRPVKRLERGGRTVEYIEVTREDIALANRLAHEVLGRSLDELPPVTRRLLELLHSMVLEQSARLGVPPGDFRFSRREVRQWAQWGDTQLKVHLGRLVDLEYVVVHRGRQGQGYVYELVYAGEGAGGERFVAGLTERASERAATTAATSRGPEAALRGNTNDSAGGGRAEVGGSSGDGRTLKTSLEQPKTRPVRDRKLANTPAPHRGNGKSPKLTVVVAATS